MSAAPGAKQRVATHGAHLARKVQHSVSSLAKGQDGLPLDLLTPSAIETRFLGASGFPEHADAIAYEPSQGLLAVGTSDGRVVLIGRPGVEATLRSTSRSPTQHLCFLPAPKGALLRVSSDGDIQLFDAVQRRLLASTWMQGDAINSVALLDPFLMLGCQSGNVRVVALLDGEGNPAAGARPAVDLALQPYQVLGQEVDGKGSVVAVAVAHLRPDRPLLLLVHRCSGALIWDIRAERILCTALDEEDEASKPTAACWVGGRANCFAVGYDDGSILVWGVPPVALQDDPFKVVEPPEAHLLMTLRVAPRGVSAAAIRSLTFLAACAGVSDGSGGDGEPAPAEDCLLVFGGQGEGEPDMLSLLPMMAQPAAGATAGGGRQIPWFGNIKGFCMMPAEGALSPDDRPRALQILTEGGQLVVHDLHDWQPQPLTLPAQELPPITCSQLVPTVGAAQVAEAAALSPRSPAPPASAAAPSPGRGGEPPSCSSAGGAPPGPQHALTLDKVRACSRRLLQAPGSGHAAEPSVLEHWPFRGGEPAASLAAGGGEGAPARRHPSALYFSGHRDGRVRVWDATTQVPELLLTIPVAAGQERLRSVTALEVCPFSGMVLVGHAGGDVRVYQFTETPQQVHRMNLDETLIPYENVAPQPGGFQYVLRYSAHSTDVTAVALATKLKLAAVADASGALSLLDLLQPCQLFCTRAMAQPVAQLAFGSHVIPGPKDEPGVERVVLFLAGTDSSASMVGLDKGEPIGRPMRPKNASRPLALTLLDAGGIPLPPLHGPMVLHWACNSAAAAPRSLAMTKVASIRESDAAAGRVGRLSLSERPLPSPLAPAGSRRSTGADSHRSWSHAESIPDADAEREGSVEVHELPSDDDLDSHLAAAIEAVEEEKRAKSKFKLPAAFKRPSSRGQTAVGGGADADLASPSSSTSGAGASGAFDPVGALQDFYGGASAGPASPDQSAGMASPDGSNRGGGAGAGAGTQREAVLLSEADLVDYPYLVDGDPTPAAYLLLCCEDYLRLYPTDNIRLGDRSTARKAAFEAPLVFAAPFMSVHGPGVASVDSADALQVHSVPGLELLSRKQLEDSRLLGFRWTAQPLLSQGSGMAGGSGTGTTSGACCSLDGQLVLAGQSNELARLAVVADCALPAPPASVYDMRVAQAAAQAAAVAAAAAAAGHRRSLAGSGSSHGAGYPVRLEAPVAAAQQVDVPAASAAAAGGQAGSFGRFFDQAASTMTGLASTAAGTVLQELDRARVAGQSALQRIADAGGGPSRPLPSLQVLFATPVEPLEDDLDYMPETEDAEKSQAAAVASSSGAAAAAAGAAAAGAAGAIAAPAAGQKPGSNLPTPREAAAKLKQLLPVGRRKNERAELLEADAAAVPASGSGSARSPAPASGGGSGWAAAGKEGGGRTVNRSASEIKRAYGRGSAAGRTGDVKSIMEQNRAMLAERGEKLENLDEKSAAMANDADDFASLAKQLHDSYANRKWWQL